MRVVRDGADWAFVEDSDVGDLVTMLPTDVPVRDDLPPDHPLYGRRALRCVPAGWPDCTVDDEGRLVPLADPVPTGEQPARRVPDGQ